MMMDEQNLTRQFLGDPAHDAEIDGGLRDDSMMSQAQCDPRIETLTGKGGLPKLRLTHSSGSTCEVYLFGATVTSYCTPQGKELLFVSERSQFNGKKAIRGGVPIVFPQFGQPDKSMPSHGFARVAHWSVDTKQSAIQPDRSVQVVLTMRDSAETFKMWPHEFELEYRISLTGRSLQTALTVLNDKLDAWSFECLLHTYFKVDDIRSVGVAGLQGAEYLDKADGGERKKEKSKLVEPRAFTDRVYVAGTGALQSMASAEIMSGNEPVAKVECTCSRAANATWGTPTPSPDLVVWNPFEQAPGDLGDGYEKMVCVEPGLVSTPVESLVNGRLTLTQTIIPL